MTELTNRHIPGITWKQVVAYSIALAFAVGFYIDLKSAAIDAKEQSAENHELFKTFIANSLQDRKLDETKLHVLELQVSEIKVRLDIMEKFIEGYNKQK